MTLREQQTPQPVPLRPVRPGPAPDRPDTPRARRGHPLVATAAFVALAALVGVGCSGGGGGNGNQVATIDDSSSSSGAGDDTGGGNPRGERDPAFEDAMLAHARCMRENGVDIPDPTFTDDGATSSVGGGAIGADPSVMEKADEACRSIMDEAIQNMPKPSAEEQAQMRDEMLAFSQCMRDQGIDMPDPTFGEDGSVTMRMGPPDELMAAEPGTSGGTDGPETIRIDPKFEEASKACSPDQGEGGMVAIPAPGMSMRVGGIEDDQP